MASTSRPAISRRREAQQFALALWYVEGEDFIAFYALKRWGDWGS